MKSALSLQKEILKQSEAENMELKAKQKEQQALYDDVSVKFYNTIASDTLNHLRLATEEK